MACPGSHPRSITANDPGADSFPASDPPSASPILGVGAPEHSDTQRQAGRDTAVEESFPASDPPAGGPMRGVGAPRRDTRTSRRGR